MPFATTWVEGYVPTVADARRITVTTLRNMQKIIDAKVSNDQFGAFRVGGHHRHGGVRWDTLSAATIAIKSKLGFPRPAAPLVRTGSMSLNTKVSVYLAPTRSGIKFDIFAQNHSPYSGFHDRPTRNHWSGNYNPVRRPIEFTPDDMRWIRAFIADSMAGGAVRTRRGRVSAMTKSDRAQLGRLLRRLFFRR